jgi:hypothetical protein
MLLCFVFCMHKNMGIRGFIKKNEILFYLLFTLMEFCVYHTSYILLPTSSFLGPTYDVFLVHAHATKLIFLSQSKYKLAGQKH